MWRARWLQSGAASRCRAFCSGLCSCSWLRACHSCHVLLRAVGTWQALPCCVRAALPLCWSIALLSGAHGSRILVLLGQSGARLFSAPMCTCAHLCLLRHKLRSRCCRQSKRSLAPGYTDMDPSHRNGMHLDLPHSHAASSTNTQAPAAVYACADHIVLFAVQALTAYWLHRLGPFT